MEWEQKLYKVLHLRFIENNASCEVHGYEVLDSKFPKRGCTFFECR